MCAAGFVFHERDWDFGALACDPYSLNLWLYGYYDYNATCNAACPPLPGDFSGIWSTTTCNDMASRECVALRLFRAHNIRIGTLDAAGVYAGLLVNRRGTTANYT